MDIKNIFEKFNPNSNIVMMELCPYYDSAQSFYSKAKVFEVDDDVFLVSYDTVVAFFNRKEKTPRVYDTYSATTLRHIKEFLKQNGFKAESKKQIEKDYII